MWGNPPVAMTPTTNIHVHSYIRQPNCCHDSHKGNNIEYRRLVLIWITNGLHLNLPTQWLTMKECDRKRVFVIVLFIIGHTRNRAQGTPGRMPNSGYSDQTQPTLQRKSNRDSGSSVERMADGGPEATGRSSCSQNGRPCPLDHHQEGPFDETNLDVDEIKVKGTTGL